MENIRHSGNGITRFIAIILMAVALCFNIYSANIDSGGDIRPADTSNHSEFNIHDHDGLDLSQLDSHEHSNPSDESDCGLCLHIGCHHNHSMIADLIISDAFSGIIVGTIISIIPYGQDGQDFGLSDRLLKPPRH